MNRLLRQQLGTVSIYLLCGCVLLLVAPSLLAAPIHDAVLEKDVATLRSLLQAGADPNSVDEGGFSALHWAIRLSHFGMVDILIDQGADVNQKTNNRASNTPLHLASFEPQADIVRVLLDNGADVNTPNSYGNIPLHIASRMDNRGVIEILASYGATVEYRNAQGNTPREVLPLKNQSENIITIPGSENSDSEDPDASAAFFRFLLSLGYIVNFESAVADLSPLSNIRLAAGAQFAFPIGQIALGFEAGGKFGPFATSAGFILIFDAYIHFLTRFPIFIDGSSIEITPAIGMFMSNFNQGLFIIPDIGVRLGFAPENGAGSIILDVAYIPPASELALINTHAYSELWSNALHISIGYAFSHTILNEPNTNSVDNSVDTAQ